MSGTACLTVASWVARRKTRNCTRRSASSWINSGVELWGRANQASKRAWPEGADGIWPKYVIPPAVRKLVVRERETVGPLKWEREASHDEFGVRVCVT